MLDFTRAKPLFSRLREGSNGCEGSLAKDTHRFLCPPPTPPPSRPSTTTTPFPFLRLLTNQRHKLPPQPPPPSPCSESLTLNVAGDVRRQVHAAVILRNLSVNSESEVKIVQEGSLPPLINLLRSNDVDVQVGVVAVCRVCVWVI